MKKKVTTFRSVFADDPGSGLFMQSPPVALYSRPPTQNDIAQRSTYTGYSTVIYPKLWVLSFKLCNLEEYILCNLYLIASFSVF